MSITQYMTINKHHASKLLTTREAA